MLLEGADDEEEEDDDDDDDDVFAPPPTADAVDAPRWKCASVFI